MYIYCMSVPFLQKVAHSVAATLPPVAVAVAVVTGKHYTCGVVCCTMGTAPNKAFEGDAL